MGNLIRLPID